MAEELEPLLARFVRGCLDVFGEDQVEGIVLHGSAAKGGSIPGFSDIDFMVFLSPDCFDEQGALPDELAFAIQERIGPLPWREAGFLYPQGLFPRRASPAIVVDRAHSRRPSCALGPPAAGGGAHGRGAALRLAALS